MCKILRSNERTSKSSKAETQDASDEALYAISTTRIRTPLMRAFETTGCTHKYRDCSPNVILYNKVYHSLVCPLLRSFELHSQVRIYARNRNQRHLDLP